MFDQPYVMGLFVFIGLSLLLSLQGCSSSSTDVVGQARPPFGADAAGPWFSELDRYLSGLVDAGRFAGPVRVVDADGTTFDRRYGPLQKVDGGDWEGELVAPVGSVTKLVTRVAVGRLMDRDRIGLSDSVGEVLAGKADEIRSVYRSVTLDALLRHQSPLPRNPAAGTTGTEVERCLASKPVQAPLPYSNCGYAVLGRMLEAATGTGLDVLFEQTVFEPLGMASTSFRPATWPSRLEWHQGALVPRPTEPTVQVSADGGLHASVADLQRLIEGIRSEGFLSSDAIARLPDLSGHAGRTGQGFIAFVAMEDDVTLAFLSVVDDAPFQTMIEDLRAIVAGETAPVRTWRLEPMKTPSTALGSCTGRYAFEDVDDQLFVVLKAGASGEPPSATVDQQKKQTLFHLALAEDGELHFVEPDDPNDLLALSVILDSAEAESERVMIRLSAGIALQAQRVEPNPQRVEPNR